jgi:hypothetical protein
MLRNKIAVSEALNAVLKDLDELQAHPSDNAARANTLSQAGNPSDFEEPTGLQGVGLNLDGNGMEGSVDHKHDAPAPNQRAELLAPDPAHKQLEHIHHALSHTLAIITRQPRHIALPPPPVIPEVPSWKDAYAAPGGSATASGSAAAGGSDAADGDAPAGGVVPDHAMSAEYLQNLEVSAVFCFFQLV